MASTQGNKRKREKRSSKSNEKDKSKKIKYWKTATTVIHPGVAGIFATCNRHREKQCTAELLDIFGEEAEKRYESNDLENGKDTDDESNSVEGIEESLSKELNALKEKRPSPLFSPVNIDCECVLFFRTKKPIDPAKFVHDICHDALESKMKSTRYTLRLSPITMTASANEDNLRDLAKKVLAPHFHVENQEPLTFAIRPTSRNHTTLNRDQIIRVVAECVGRPHKVDLANPDITIIVECFKNIVGMSAVTDFDKLKRYNLQQIFESSSNEN
ncbi:hypothetical protein V1511DRAFT_507392 [Dipodascopsis uninucleata]